MPTRIIGERARPFALRDIDMVTLDIIENALRHARIDMDATLARTAMGLGIREQGDAFPLIADPQGRMILCRFGSFVGGFPQDWDGSIEDRGMIVLSDP